MRDYDFLAQIPQEDGIIGAPGTPYHPDTAWNPEPWGRRHRIYLANDADQTTIWATSYREGIAGLPLVDEVA